MDTTPHGAQECRLLVQRMTPRAVTVVCLVCVVCFFLLSAIGWLLAPPEWFGFRVDASGCPDGLLQFEEGVCKGVDFSRGIAWQTKINGLNSLNERLYLSGEFSHKNPDLMGVVEQLYFRVTVHSANSEEGVPLDQRSWTKVFEKTFPKWLTCHHHSSKCEPVPLLAMPYIDSQAYSISVQIADDSENGVGEDDRGSVAQQVIGLAKFDLTVRNEHFAYTILIWKTIFLGVTLAFSCLFVAKIWNYPWRCWSIEQKWMLILLAAVMLYDNPFSWLRYEMDSGLTVIVNKICFETFLCSLLLFWLCILDGIRRHMDDDLWQTSSDIRRFYFPKLLLVGIIWVVSVTFSSFVTLKRVADPEYSEISDFVVAQYLAIVIWLLLVVYLAWVFLILVKSYAVLSLLPNFSIRLRAFGIPASVILAMTLLHVLLQILYALPDVLPLLYLAMYNLYVLMMGILYLPSDSIPKTETVNEIQLSDLDLRGDDDGDGDDDDDGGVKVGEDGEGW